MLSSIAKAIDTVDWRADNIVGSSKENKDNYDLMTAIMLRLGNVTDKVEQPILRLLDVLLSAEKRPEEKKEVLEHDFNIPMSDSISKEINEMCNLGQGLVEMTELRTTANIVIS